MLEALIASLFRPKAHYQMGHQVIQSTADFDMDKFCKKLGKRKWKKFLVVLEKHRNARLRKLLNTPEGDLTHAEIRDELKQSIDIDSTDFDFEDFFPALAQYLDWPRL